MLDNIISNVLYRNPRPRGRGGFGPVSDFTYSGDSKALSSNIRGMDWDPTGNSLIVSYRIDRSVVNLVSTSPPGDDWSMTRTSPNNYRYGFIPEIASGGSCWSCLMTESPAGVPGGQLLLNLALGLSNNQIVQYTLPMPYELRQGNPPSSSGAPYYPDYTPVLVGKYNTSGDMTADQVNDMRMSPDGTRLLAMISDGAAKLVQWNLTVPFDVLGGMSYQTPITMTGYSFEAMFIEPGGKSIYFIGSNAVHRHTLSTPWEISSINMTEEDSLDFSAQGTTGRSLFLTEKNLYVLASSTIFKYDA